MAMKQPDGFNEWAVQPEVTGVNRLPSRATLTAFDSFDAAKSALDAILGKL